MKLDRIDLSDNLIHFVRELDISTEDYNKSEMHPKEYLINGDIVEENLLSPFFILRRIIRNLQLISTWSYRKGNRSVYGDFPAICFTEMPISGFVKTSIDRQSKGQKISNYGLVFDKKQMFEIGARPVIYGTSQNVSVIDKNDIKYLDPEIFESKELYRYIAFNLNRLPYPIDWTHEREWRWPNYDYKYYPIDLVLIGEEECGEELKELYRQREEERIDFHGLNIDTCILSNIGIILKTEEQARLIIRDILWLVDTKKLSKNTFGYVLFFNKLEQNIEKLTNIEFIDNEIKQGLIKLDSFFSIDSNMKNEIYKKIEDLCERYKDYNDFNLDNNRGLFGPSFPCLKNNEDKITRVLVDLNLVKFTKLGRYLIDLPVLHPSCFMENNEYFVKKIINPELEKILGIELTYYSVGNSNKHDTKKIEIDDVPFYTEVNDDEWNFAHREEDY